MASEDGRLLCFRGGGLGAGAVWAGQQVRRGEKRRAGQRFFVARLFLFAQGELRKLFLVVSQSAPRARGGT